MVGVGLLVNKKGEIVIKSISPFQNNLHIDYKECFFSTWVLFSVLSFKLTIAASIIMKPAVVNTVIIEVNSMKIPEMLVPISKKPVNIGVIKPLILPI